MPNDNSNSFAQLNPILLSPNNNVDKLKQYYIDNGLTPDNEYMHKYMYSAPVSSSPSIEPSQNIDIKALLANNLTKTPFSTPQKAISDINVNNAMFTPRESTSKKAKEAINFFINKGYTKEVASGITGNLYAESGLNPMRPQNNGGPGFGLAQWEGPRQAQFKQIMGKDIKNSTAKDQLEFIDWELNNTQKHAKAELLKTKSPAEAAFAFANKYERMKKYNKERENYAQGFYTL